MSKRDRNISNGDLQDVRFTGFDKETLTDTINDEMFYFVRNCFIGWLRKKGLLSRVKIYKSSDNDIKIGEWTDNVGSLFNNCLSGNMQLKEELGFNRTINNIDALNASRFFGSTIFDFIPELSRRTELKKELDKSVKESTSKVARMDEKYYSSDDSASSYRGFYSY